MTVLSVQHKYSVFLVCAAGIFITVFDGSSAIVALPNIASDLAVGLPVAQWVIIANTLTVAALLVPVGRLSDLIGRKLIYVTGCALFALGSAAAWLTNGIEMLIAARCIMGVGSAMTQGTAMAILVSNFPVSERARMLGMQMAAVGLGAIAGPALGGLIVGTVGWRRLFLITLLAMLAIGYAGHLVLRRRAQRPEGTPPFNIAGAILFSAALTLGLFTLTLAPVRGWMAPVSMLGYAGAVLLAGLFWWVERRQPAPMLDLQMLRNPAFSLGAVAAMVVFMGMAATRFLSPFFLQGIRGFSPTEVGLLMLPAAFATALVAPLAGRIADRVGVRLCANIGMCITLLGLGSFTLLSTASPTWAVVSGLVILALGMSAFGAPNSAAILNSVPADAHGLAAGFVNLCRNMGNVLGIAVGTAVVSVAMTNAGFAPSLTDVNVNSAAGVGAAFTSGMRSACALLLLLLLPVTVLIVHWSIRRARAGHP